MEAKKGRNKGCIILVIVALVIAIVGFCGLCALIFSLGGYTGQANSSIPSTIYQGSGEGSLAVINISGPITDAPEASLLGGSTFAVTSTIVSQLDTALEDDEVKAVLLRIESPGGEVSASDIIYNKVMEVREKKPVVAYSSTTAASGGYYIASAADEFIVHPSAITGSIGVILQTQSLEGLYEKLGIQTKTFKSGELKDDSQLYDQNPDGEIEEVFQNLVNENYEMFLDAIVAGRDMDKEELRKLADGRIYTGKQAVEKKLADGLGYEEDAINIAEEMAGHSDLTIIKYDQPGYFQLLLGNRLAFLSKFEQKSTPGVKAYYLIAL